MELFVAVKLAYCRGYSIYWPSRSKTKALWTRIPQISTLQPHRIWRRQLLLVRSCREKNTVENCLFDFGWSMWYWIVTDNIVRANWSTHKLLGFLSYNVATSGIRSNNKSTNYFVCRLILEMMKRREKTKKEHLKLTVEVAEKRLVKCSASLPKLIALLQSIWFASVVWIVKLCHDDDDDDAGDNLSFILSYCSRIE